MSDATKENKEQETEGTEITGTEGNNNQEKEGTDNLDQKDPGEQEQESLLISSQESLEGKVWTLLYENDGALFSLKEIGELTSSKQEELAVVLKSLESQRRIVKSCVGSKKGKKLFAYRNKRESDPDEELQHPELLKDLPLSDRIILYLGDIVRRNQEEDTPHRVAAEIQTGLHHERSLTAYLYRLYEQGILAREKVGYGRRDSYAYKLTAGGIQQYEHLHGRVLESRYYLSRIRRGEEVGSLVEASMPVSSVMVRVSLGDGRVLELPIFKDEKTRQTVLWELDKLLVRKKAEWAQLTKEIDGLQQEKDIIEKSQAYLRLDEEMAQLAREKENLLSQIEKINPGFLDRMSQSSSVVGGKASVPQKIAQKKKPKK